ncbi:TPA: hypothetical protein ACHK9X_RS24910, partial [Escherichia coli]
RKWYGNIINIIKYDKATYEILSVEGNKLPSRDYYFKPCLNWTRISSPSGSFRYSEGGTVFESASLTAYADDTNNIFLAMAAANSKMVEPQLDLVNPTVNFLSGYFDMLTLPRDISLYQN